VSAHLVPRPAATVLLVRDSVAGVEVLMLRRNLNSDFVGGAYVFPGGSVDLADADVHHVAVGLDDETASQRLSLESGGLAYYVACLREVFEESGLLLALTESGEYLKLSDPATRERFSEHRRALNAQEITFRDIIAQEKLRLDLTALEYYSHWVTPIGPPRRFDTRFFVALAPEDQEAAHDAGETVADTWITPSDALERVRRRELDMIFPTIKNLEGIAHLHSAADVLRFARELRDIPRIEPRIVERDGGAVILMPHDDGFHD
jgi:8-oxo-dGTP pyrophosphatase MutT (NUDIX family)